jgi:hypothetical protein
MARGFSIGDFFVRWLFAAVLVLGTYNPTDYSYVGWLTAEETEFGPVTALIGVALLIAWIIYLRATFLSMGWLGIVLGGALFGCLVWLLIDLGWLSLDSGTAFTWAILLILSAILAVGMSWAHIRRLWSGQLSVDDVED